MGGVRGVVYGMAICVWKLMDVSPVDEAVGVISGHHTPYLLVMTLVGYEIGPAYR